MHRAIPAINGKQLISLLEKDGWEKRRRAKHGIALSKYINGVNKVTIIPDTKASLLEGTLQAILSMKQTGIGKRGLLQLINKYGI